MLPALNAYRTPSWLRSVIEVAITAVPFVLLWLAMLASLEWSYLLTLLLAVPTAGFLVRLFLIQHDCGHGSFFKRRLTNDWVGRIISVFTMTPYDDWQRSHATHHANVGNLDRRGVGDITTLTIAEYQGLSPWGRLGYRLYRHPFVMFGIGPAYVFLVRHRMPSRERRMDWRAWVSPMLTNVAIAAVATLVISLVGLGPFLMIELPVVVLAASMGVWLFYIQHQFEDTTWDHEGSWSVHEAALHGSSYYHLPAPLRWLTANIGAHHVHHLCSRIPYYRLETVLRDHPELETVGKITFLESLACVRLALWDEARGRMISFRDLASDSGRGPAG
ncbi:MAG: fatty acid desaturase [Hyphomicrobiaceae bacterium]|nr:fatty acid desaturase [Hyphomicrobiaceae bacterium]